MKVVFTMLILWLSSTALADDLVDCNRLSNTLEIKECLDLKIELSKMNLNRYFRVTIEENYEDVEFVKALEKAQEKWEGYMRSHCGMIQYSGTISGITVRNCEKRLIENRTHEIWREFLQSYGDEVVLPEPYLSQ